MVPTNRKTRLPARTRIESLTLPKNIMDSIPELATPEPIPEGAFTVEDAAAHSGKARSTCDALLRRLAKEGKLKSARRVGTGMPRYYWKV
jgi:hypothetical protein